MSDNKVKPTESGVDTGLEDAFAKVGVEEKQQKKETVASDNTTKPTKDTTASPATKESKPTAPKEPIDSWAQEVEEQESSEQAKADASASSKGTSKAPEGEGKATDPETADTKDSAEKDSLLHFLEDAVEVKLADQQADVSSPLYSVHSFDDLGLTPELLKGVYAMKFTKPSKIQERALPLLLSEPPRNMIGQSQSGTGKTAAFVLAMLSRVKYDLNEVQAICLAPTRELARQIMDVAKEMSQFATVNIDFCIRDDSRPRGVIKSQIVVGTPGTVLDAIQRRRLDTRHIKMYVLDEADNMLDMQGLGDQCSRIKKFLPKTCQYILFSATFPDDVREFAHFFAPGANEISLKRQELSIKAIKQFYLDCPNTTERDKILADLYGLMTIGQSIIFVNTRKNSERISNFMSKLGYHVIALHGAQDLHERDEMIDSFRTGKAKVLVTTNVLARGIDISQVNLVINFDMPVDHRGNPDPETYLHRIGRTGRFGRSGVAINFIHNKESFQVMTAMESHFEHPVIKLEMSDFEATEKILKKALK